MAHLDFPASPTVGQTYSVAGSPTFQWDGEKWTIPASGGSGIYVSDTPPASAPDNSLWWESDSGLMFVRFNDGDTTQWVVASPVADTSQYLKKTSATLNLFVNGATGNDSNDGLTAGTAFATPGKAMDYIASIHTGTFGANVAVANATYGQLVLKTYSGSGAITFTGNPTTPSACVIAAVSSAIATTAFGGSFVLNGFRLQSTGAQDVLVSSPTTVTLQNCEFNGSSANYRLYVTNFGNLSLVGTNKVMTGGLGLFLVGDGAAKLGLGNATINFGANVTYSGATFTGRRGGYCECPSTVFALGGFVVTGTRYSLTACSNVAGTGASATFFPGTVAGAADATSVYG